MIRRLRLKIVITMMIMMTVMLCLVFGLIYYFTAANLENESMSMLQSIASDSFKPGPGDEQVRFPYFTLEVTNRGEVLASGYGFDLSDEDLVRDLVEISSSSGGQSGTIREYSLRYYQTDVPGGRLLLFADISSELSSLSSMLRTFIFLGILSLLVFLGVSILLSRWAVRPVESALKQQRQFVADASHEMKTPLTVIMTNSELLQEPGFDEESRQRFSANILAMARQMRRLLEQLLDLARLDNGQLDVTNSETLSFSDTVTEEAMAFEPVFFEKGLTLEYKVEENCVVRGSENHLKQVVDVLLDNAQKYAYPDSTAELELKKAGRGRCILSVSTEGEDLSREELTDIFTRFYRRDEARSRDGSFGLGLSIAQQIVQEHHGR
ncbi:MAG: HAMP domain-containing histidine kinase, partial [Oscillospiraceae bacterium]|nr:HAMP domain-containing histidine kinase [Oscillospiraceae bacterium]